MRVRALDYKVVDESYTRDEVKLLDVSTKHRCEVLGEP